MELLKPCPFCGGEATLREATETRNAYVFCDGACSFVMDGETNEEAITAWNQRAERTCRIVPHGHLFTLSDGTELYESACSECGAYIGDEDNYCSICGARVVE